MDDIANKVTSLIKDYANKGISFLTSQPWWLQVVIVLVVGILLLMGLISFIKKIWKFVLVVAIIGGIGYGIYYLYSTETFSSLLSPQASVGLIPYLLQLI